MNLVLNNETHPEVEVLQINIANNTVDFRDPLDGICNAPYTAVGDIPTEDELTTAIEAVLGETNDRNC